MGKFRHSFPFSLLLVLAMLRLFSLALVLLLGTYCQAAPAEAVDPNRPALRKPADLVLSQDGRFLLTANRGSGTISVVERATQKTAQEWQIGQSLVHLLPLAEGRLLALDGALHEAVLLRLDGVTLEILSTLKLPHSPVRAVVHPDGKNDRRELPLAAKVGFSGVERRPALA